MTYWRFILHLHYMFRVQFRIVKFSKDAQYMYWESLWITPHAGLDIASHLWQHVCRYDCTTNSQMWANLFAHSVFTQRCNTSHRIPMHSVLDADYVRSVLVPRLYLTAGIRLNHRFEIIIYNLVWLVGFFNYLAPGYHGKNTMVNDD